MTFNLILLDVCIMQFMICWGKYSKFGRFPDRLGSNGFLIAECNRNSFVRNISTGLLRGIMYTYCSDYVQNCFIVATTIS